MRRARAVALPDGFDDFVIAQTQPLLRLALALTGNSHDAWDLLQETFVRTGERWARAQVEEPMAYARTVMVRLNIDRLRRLRRLRREVPWHSPVENNTPADWAPSGDSASWLPAALATLSPRQRTALALRYVEDLDVRTIAERMGCSEGTVKSQLSRGTARLKQHAPPSVAEVGTDDDRNRRTPR